MRSELPAARSGVVGYQLPPLKPAVTSMMPSDTIIFAADGIRSRFVQGLSLRHFSMKPAELADYILREHDKGTDDSLVLVVRYLGNEP